ncbi:putative secreted protein (Por secretion system target) [Flavobacteriaceae bacterium MAR_2010_105]|nr:putative secreted protein (Por secretion system target) [Flavobacteriaceae bacterium MAR_2010_105]
MERNLLALFFALSFLISNAQYTAIPDSNFEQALINLGIDSEGGPVDGQVLTADISSVEILGVANQSISNLTGIQDFTALRRLVCNNNNIATLDLSSNMNLEALFCHFNSMTSLTLPPTNTLYDLQCYQNSLTSLDVSNNTGLQVLWCYNNNIQNTLDASNCTILENFDCGFNQILSINMPNDSNTLWRFLCDNNNLSNLDVSNNSVLTDFQCYNNPSLLSLDLTNNQLLERVFCYNNTSMSSMLLPTTSTLTDIDAFTTGLTSLDASGLNGLEYLRLNQSLSLTNLILPNTTTLQTLWMYTHAVSNLDLSNNTGLVNLDIANGNLSNIDVSMLNNLQNFYCNESDLLTSLNVQNGNNHNMPYMWANDNPLLNCIQVDNPALAESYSNWLKDAGANFSSNCSLGIDEFNKDAVVIYPNPASDRFNVDIKTEAFYSLTNLLGKEIIKGNFVTGSNTLDIGSLSNGLYVLHLETSDGKVTKKLIKE